MPGTRSSSSSSSRQNLSSSTPDDDRITNTLLTLNALYQTHIHPLLPEQLQPLSTSLSNAIFSSAPYLSHLIGILRTLAVSASNVATNAQDGSALLSVGILLITLYMGLRIANYIRRTIMGWVWLGVKLVLLLVAVQVGMYVNSYGWERAVRQAGWLGGIAWGLLEDMLDGDQQQQRQPRGTRRRGQSAYNQYARPQAGGGRYG